MLAGFFTITGVALGGLALVLAFALELFKKGFPVDGVIALAAFSIIMLLCTTVLLGRQLSRLINAYLQPGESKPKQKLKSCANPPAEIAAPPAPASSITEHTTRTFAPILQQRDV